MDLGAPVGTQAPRLFHRPFPTAQSKTSTKSKRRKAHQSPCALHHDGKINFQIYRAQQEGCGCIVPCCVPPSPPKSSHTDELSSLSPLPSCAIAFSCFVPSLPSSPSSWHGLWQISSSQCCPGVETSHGKWRGGSRQTDVSFGI